MENSFQGPLHDLLFDVRGLEAEIRLQHLEHLTQRRLDVRNVLRRLNELSLANLLVPVQLGRLLYFLLHLIDDDLYELQSYVFYVPLQLFVDFFKLGDH